MADLPEPNAVLMPPDLGPPLPDHPLADKENLTNQEIETLLALLPGPRHQYLLGRTLLRAGYEDYDRDDPRPLLLTVNVRYLYKDSEVMCFHFVPPKVVPQLPKLTPHWTVPIYICPFYEDMYVNCGYRETMTERHWRRTRRLPLVIPRKAQTFPAGIRPHWVLRRPTLHGLGFVGPVRAPPPAVERNPANYLHSDDEDDLDDEDDQEGAPHPDDSTGLGHIDWDQRAAELIAHFRTPSGLPFAAYFLREMLEDYRFLAEDVNQALLTELKTLGQRPPEMGDWPRPANDYWKRRMDQFSNFMGISNPEPMIEQRHAVPKQFIVLQILLMKQLHDAHAQLNINWQKCLNIVDHRIAVTDRFFERTNFRTDRMTEKQFRDAKLVMEQIAPSSSRRDRTRAEREARGEVEPLRQPPANYPGLAPANQHFPGRRSKVSKWFTMQFIPGLGTTPTHGDQG
ncbi:hypothetical protein CALCODRAFT_506440 [Calocera cornea HHB12733]|uniref:Uncharacterized protein n=1 Tax=Calocera cornea HHB12733 TaxID=1353952 RepID=A0A165IUN9_9BASI|nr:hypothetical protein CALCODRAFT_506440 [Calocera cornea HHB12733]